MIHRGVLTVRRAMPMLVFDGMGTDTAWVERERRTARLVRAVLGQLGTERLDDADTIHALCRLTWITKSQDGSNADNTRAVVAPALGVLLETELRATTPADLAKLLAGLEVPDAIVREARRPVGFVNFYAAFRKSSLAWLGKHRREVTPLIREATVVASDRDVEQIYKRVAALASLPRPNAGALPAYNLLTPLLACLDSRGRAPIINAREAVKQKLRRLGLSNATLPQQCRGLMGLINQGGFVDAFELDVADAGELPASISAAKVRREQQAPSREHDRPRRELAERVDDDVEFLRSAERVVHRRLHNKMTNALRAICECAGCEVEEGAESTCMFDALILRYLGDERALLIEVKTDTSAPFVRMAIGQLFDYRRQLRGNAAIDLAVLLPERPPRQVREYLDYVGVKALWLSPDLTEIRGALVLGVETRADDSRSDHE